MSDLVGPSCHGINPATVKAEATAASFVLDGESVILANPAVPLAQTGVSGSPLLHGWDDEG